MDSTFNAFLKCATRVRPFRCVVVSVSLVLLGFLLTTAVLLNESFPVVESADARGEGEESLSPIKVSENGSSRKLEADGEYSPVIRKKHGFGHLASESSDGVESVVQVRSESEAVVEKSEGRQNGDGDGVKQAIGNGIQQPGGAEVVTEGPQLRRTSNANFRDRDLAGAPAVVAVAPRVAPREELNIAPVAAKIGARKSPVARPILGKRGGRLAPVPAPPIAVRKKGSLASPDVQVPSEFLAGEESDSEGGEQREDNEGKEEEVEEEEEDLDYFQQAIRNGTVIWVDHTRWDTKVGCKNFLRKHSRSSSSSRSLQNSRVDNCTMLRKQHVSVLVKEWQWIPDSLNNLYSCECGLTCLWTNSEALVEKPDVHLYESTHPPDERRRKGQPWRVYLDLEPGRNRGPSEDLFVSYHAEDDIQVTYAGASFHVIRSYYISPLKHDDVLVYWSSSRCLYDRQRKATEFLGLLPHHSFGKCLNNVGGPDMILHMYPKCSRGSGAGMSWSQNLHCAMSHYKFVLAIENTRTESYVTEKLFYALDAGSVPIYFGARNVLDFVPPNSIIDGNKFASMRKLAEYVKKVGADPVLYAEFHAWRRCGVMGPYGRTRAVSLDSLPCRLCAAVFHDFLEGALGERWFRTSHLKPILNAELQDLPNMDSGVFLIS